MKFALSLAAIATVLFSASVTSAAPAGGPNGQTAALISTSQYCLFLPRDYGGDIAESEDDAVAFCNTAIPTAPNARKLPTGFVQSIHFVNNTSKSYVQITGRIDRSKYGLSESDGGGQYDIKAPVGSKCAGYGYYVQLLEPDEEIYCLRCCKNKSDCPVNKSTYGCRDVLGGDYS
ncbi:hypothetical protein BX616_004364 [Lobosporangium transversale]|uniref:Uncharacterized protein n=1 Tax=Lobosporangium transversale TaxID=64571 RepID=A0A1Y2GG33_9FUNG|nr:hypothetical protein BCR41DRAFT_358444 [Lobosporangium transversale]KAF9916195.1 hypothetical protein BX616_004364 [Lobosporangium transversale]ORZ09768.1 hypothetical protein BCR41DRAFT_358444 [Lobosporangium transversale]|eukprot:XP_021879038.1 hypothetical protein BCR41DRAFT_358444 [Lobosporangium transversale]